MEAAVVILCVCTLYRVNTNGCHNIHYTHTHTHTQQKLRRTCPNVGMV